MRTENILLEVNRWAAFCRRFQPLCHVGHALIGWRRAEMSLTQSHAHTHTHPASPPPVRVQTGTGKQADGHSITLPQTFSSLGPDDICGRLTQSSSDFR